MHGGLSAGLLACALFSGWFFARSTGTDEPPLSRLLQTICAFTCLPFCTDDPLSCQSDCLSAVTAGKNLHHDTIRKVLFAPLWWHEENSSGQVRQHKFAAARLAARTLFERRW